MYVVGAMLERLALVVNELGNDNREARIWLDITAVVKVTMDGC